MDLIIRFYRMLFCRGGFGIHSPFVFDLMTEVIEEQRLYYCYEPLQSARVQIRQRRDKVQFGNLNLTTKEMLKKYGFTELEHRLLFRLANHFQPKTILTLGSDFGLTPLYLTAYSTNAVCMVVEPESSISKVAQEYITQYTTATIDLRNDDGEIPDELDFVVLGAYPGNIHTGFSKQTFERFLPFIHEKSVMVIKGINASPQAHKAWKAVCAHPKVTVSIDLLRLGVVFFNPDLHRRTYKSII